MRAKELMWEDEYKARSLLPPELPGIDKLIEMISSECSDIVAAYSMSNKLLLRGENNSVRVFTKKIRPDRIPVEMDKDAHEIIHKFMLANGMAATRKNSIFCSAQYNTAESWGSQVYAVFPRNGWKASWFDGLSNSSYSFNDLSHIVSDSRNWEFGGKGTIDNDDLMRGLNDLAKKYPPTTTSNPSELAHYLSSRPFEIMIAGDSYIGIDAFILDTSVGQKLLSALNIQYKL